MEKTSTTTPKNSLSKTNDRASAAALALASVILLCFVPDQPFGISNGVPDDHLEKTKAEAIHETFRVYEVLRANAPAFDEYHAWKLAVVVRAESRKHSFDPMLVLAIIKAESAFEEKALSVKGAQGLMQLLPFVAEAVAQENDIEGWIGKTSLYDPFVNVQLGVSYLNTLKAKFRDLPTTLAAYRWGPTEITNRIDQEIPVPLEYSSKVLEYYRIFRSKRPEVPKVIPKFFESQIV